MKTSLLVFIGILISSASYARDCKEADANNKTSNNNQGRALSTEKVEKEAVVEKKEPEGEKTRPFHHSGTLENRL